MKRTIRGITAASVSLGLMGSGIAAVSAAPVACKTGATCRWDSNSYSGKVATAAGDNNDYTWPGQNHWDNGSSGLNDGVNSLTNYGASCWITFDEDSNGTGAAITFDKRGGAFQWQDPYLGNGGGYKGSGRSALGGSLATSDWHDRISSHDFCS